MADVSVDPRRDQPGCLLDPDERFISALLRIGPAPAVEKVGPQGERNEAAEQQEPGNKLAQGQRITKPLPKAPEVEDKKCEDTLPGEETVETVGLRDPQGGSAEPGNPGGQNSEYDDPEHHLAPNLPPLYDQEAVAIVDVAESALSLIRYDKLFDGKTVTSDYVAQPVVLCDKGRIKQVLINLLQNAAHATDGCDCALIKVEVCEDSDYGIVNVVDKWAAIYKQLGDEDGIKYLMIFENRGTIMGNSQPHPHGQVYAYGEIPDLMVRPQIGMFRTYRESKDGRCFVCDANDVELNDGRRILVNRPN